MNNHIYCVDAEPEWWVCFVPLEVCLPLGLGLITTPQDIQTKPTCTPEETSLLSHATYHLPCITQADTHLHGREGGPQLPEGPEAFS